MFTMISNHFPTVYGSSAGWVILMVLIAVGWFVTKLLYGKAATPAPGKSRVFSSGSYSTCSQSGLR